MNKLKKALSLLLSLALVPGLLSGCQKPAGDASGTPSSSGGPGSSASNPSDPSSSSGSSAPSVDLESITDICQFTAGIPSDTVLATVDGTDITAMELLYWVARACDNLLSYYYSYGVPSIPWDSLPTDGETTLPQYILDDALERAALYHLAESRAAAAQLTVSQEDKDAIQNSLDAVELEQSAKGVSLERYMWQYVLDPELYTWFFQCEYLHQALTDSMYGEDSGSRPGDQAVIDGLHIFRVKHILLMTQGLSEDEAAAKKTQAEDLLAQLRADGSEAKFDELMNQYSEDSGLQTNPDGYIFTDADSLIGGFREAALELKEGEISGIVETDYGYHIMLRLPLTLDEQTMESYRSDYISDLMSQHDGQWLAAADVRSTDAYKALDVRAFYEALGTYRTAMAQ